MSCYLTTDDCSGILEAPLMTDMDKNVMILNIFSQAISLNESRDVMSSN